MCKNFIDFKDGKVVNIKGIFRKGTYSMCLDCEAIFKRVGRNNWKLFATLKQIKYIRKIKAK